MSVHFNTSRKSEKRGDGLHIPILGIQNFESSSVQIGKYEQGNFITTAPE
jgi:hypothetical protein